MTTDGCKPDAGAFDQRDDSGLTAAYGSLLGVRLRAVVRLAPAALGSWLDIIQALYSLESSVTWEVVVIEPARSWLHSLRRSDRTTLRQISNAIDVLAIEGPGLGRPLVDTVRGSRVANLKELRPGSSGGKEVRLLFVFEPARRAVILVGGDKAGIWKRWYDRAIADAEKAYELYLAEASKEGRDEWQ